MKIEIKTDKNILGPKRRNILSIIMNRIKNSLLGQKCEKRGK